MLFWILVLLVSVFVFFVLSFLFDHIGRVGMKMYQKFKENIGGNNNEK